MFVVLLGLNSLGCLTLIFKKSLSLLSIATPFEFEALLDSASKSSRLVSCFILMKPFFWLLCLE